MALSDNVIYWHALKCIGGAMSSVQKSIRIPDEVAKTIQEEADISGRDFSAVANVLLAEAVKTKRCPGIFFADGPSGRRATLCS
jgi:hypothetical protein